MTEQPILVSVRCTVFNHAPYLKQCLDGFLKQQTEFRFEVFVHDDASTDESAQIILDYAREYPDIIIPFIEEKNIYSLKNGSFSRITYSKDYLRGKYIAICEGDDYWTDPLKLQIQVDYLESHPDCAMVFGNAIEHWEDASFPDRPFAELEGRDYSGVELSQRWIVPTATLLFRREVLDSKPFLKSMFNPKIMAGDLPLCLSCAEIGSLHCLNQVLSVYRRTSKGFWRSLDASGRLRMGDERIEIYRVFGKAYRKSSIGMAFYHYMRAWQLAKEEKNNKLRKKAIGKSLRLACQFPLIAAQRISLVLKERNSANFGR